MRIRASYAFLLTMADTYLFSNLVYSKVYYPEIPKSNSRYSKVENQEIPKWSQNHVRLL